MSGPTRFEVNRGSDLVFRLNWQDENGNIDLTGYTLSLFEEDSRLTDNTTLSITTPADGEIEVNIQWNNDFPSHEDLVFRVVAQSGTVDIALPELSVFYT